MRRKSVPSRPRWIEVFIRPAQRYNIETLIRVTGVSRRELNLAVNERAVVPVNQRGEMFFSSEDVKALVLRRWTAGMLAKILPPAVVPPLNVIERVTIELPAHQRKFLELRAAKESAPDRLITPSDVVQRLVDELISSMELQDWIETDSVIPSFTEAVNWPLAL